MWDSVPFTTMETYLVGGAVRDKLLGLPVHDKDWVVVGATPERMLEKGFIAVGKDFPVFLHPQTHEEYALARTERKTGPGYHGFEFDTAQTVTLEEDLSRRDLSINAIAEDEHGNIIDPFNAQQDIKNKVLRHVAPAFAEDPVRVLRTAKFMARFSHLGFTVAQSTVTLIQNMVSSGEVDNLVAERVWKELEASLGTKTPQAFFTTMHNTHALERVVPELVALSEKADQIATKPQADTSQADYLKALTRACANTENPSIRFAAMCVVFNSTGAEKLQSMCTRLRVPNSTAELALLCAKYTERALAVNTLNAEQIYTLLKALDVTRRPKRFDEFLLALQTAASSNSDNSLQETLLRTYAQAMTGIDAGKIAKQQTEKSQIPIAIRQQEVAAIQALLP